MIKLICNAVKLVIAFVMSLFMTSCVDIQFDSSLESIKGDGNVVTQSRTVSESFTKVKASRGLNVIISQGDSNRIEVVADDNLHDHILTSFKDGWLEITSDRNIQRASSKTINVEIKSIEALTSNSGAKLNSSGKLIASNFSANCTSGAELNIEVETEKIIVDGSSGSNTKISGKALEGEFSISSGGNIDARDLLINEITAGASSGASLRVHPILALEAKASSGGSILYYNEPKTISKRTSSGGSVKLK
ncbi:MAG: head GIN domain-containing protein [Flavobacterium sp.]